MALHIRAQLRRRVVALLKGLPTTADRVLPGRRRNLAADHQPTLLVYTEDEDIGLGEMGRPAVQDRRVMLMVEGRANGRDEVELEDLLDAIAAEVEPCVFANWSFDGLAVATDLVKTRSRVLAAGELLAGGIRLEFRVLYSTAEGAPTEVV